MRAPHPPAQPTQRLQMPAQCPSSHRSGAHTEAQVDCSSELKAAGACCAASLREEFSCREELGSMCSVLRRRAPRVGCRKGERDRLRHNPLSCRWSCLLGEGGELHCSQYIRVPRETSRASRRDLLPALSTSRPEWRNNPAIHETSRHSSAVHQTQHPRTGVTHTSPLHENPF